MLHLRGSFSALKFVGLKVEFWDHILSVDRDSGRPKWLLNITVKTGFWQRQGEGRSRSVDSFTHLTRTPGWTPACSSTRNPRWYFSPLAIQISPKKKILRSRGKEENKIPRRGKTHDCKIIQLKYITDSSQWLDTPCVKNHPPCVYWGFPCTKWSWQGKNK